jgi:hypothetical protein
MGDTLQRVAEEARLNNWDTTEHKLQLNKELGGQIPNDQLETLVLKNSSNAEPESKADNNGCIGNLTDIFNLTSRQLLRIKNNFGGENDKFPHVLEGSLEPDDLAQFFADTMVNIQAKAGRTAVTDGLKKLRSYNNKHDAD